MKYGIERKRKIENLIIFISPVTIMESIGTSNMRSYNKLSPSCIRKEYQIPKVGSLHQDIV